MVLGRVGSANQGQTPSCQRKLEVVLLERDADETRMPVLRAKLVSFRGCCTVLTTAGRA